MRLRSRVFLGILVVVGIGFAFLLNWMLDDVSPQYRKATEEPLVDAARVLASVTAMTLQDGHIDTALCRSVFNDVYSRSCIAQINDFVKSSVDFRVSITDAMGTVVFDSASGPEGKRAAMRERITPTGGACI